MDFANEINAGEPEREGSAGKDVQMSAMLLLFLEILRVNDHRYLYNSRNPFRKPSCLIAKHALWKTALKESEGHRYQSRENERIRLEK
ncbi:MAG TPA: hypothetical protein VIU13_07865, partial [Chryseolinea sp.]